VLVLGVTATHAAGPSLTGTRALASTATALTMSADPRATNTIDAPARVVPVRSTVTGVKSGFTYTVPKQGIVVLTMWTC
jgi:alpha-L-arabinofuranosidase